MTEVHDEITTRTQEILAEPQFTESGFILNSSQIPDVLFDWVEGLVTPEEWKVITYVARRTPEDQISIEQMVGGQVVNGKRVDRGTGLSAGAIRRALRFLVGINLVVRHATRYESRFAIQTDYRAIDWAVLARRRAKKEATDKKRIVKARDQNSKVTNELEVRP